MTVNLALVGLGRWAIFLALALQKTAGVCLVKGYDEDPAAAKDFTDMFNLSLAGSLKEIIEDPSIDGLVVVTANHTHASVARRCLAAEKCVFVEKPLAHTLKEASELTALAEKKGCILMTGHNSRRYPSLRKLKQLLLEQRIGPVWSATAVHSYRNPWVISEESWRNDAIKCPGGPLMQLAIHQADNLLWLLGPVNRVQGVLLDPLPGGKVPAGGRLLLDFASGATGSIDSDYVTSPENFSITLRGEKGELHACGSSLVSITDDSGTEKMQLGGSEEASLEEEMSEFVQCIRTGEKPETDGRAGLEALRIILLGLEAAASGRSVEVDRA